MSIHGIDASEFQGTVNWEQVRAAGIQFAMLRAGLGIGTVDGQFRRNAQECNRLGIPFGVYWFSYAYTEELARQEAEACIRTIQDYEVQYPVCFDFEEASVSYAASLGVNVTPAMASAFVEAFCDRVEELGYFAMYYSNLDYLNRIFAERLRQKYALWLAQYASAPSLSDIAMWQYRNNGRVAGISGNVDMDIAYYDLAEVISRAGLNRLQRQVTTPPSSRPEPVDVISYTVREGDTLSGIAARYGTTWQRIASYNGITDPDLIYVGQVLRIPLGTRAGAERYYTVRSGDTLSGIALRYGTTVRRLQQVNGIADANLIYVGQILQV